MKRNKLFLKICCLVCAGVMLLAVTGCPTGEDDTTGGELVYNDTPVTSFSGTIWSDDLIPESTIQFTSASSVTLDGRYFNKQKLEINGSQTPVDLSGPKTYEAAGDLSGVKVEPAVRILFDTQNRKGIELYYYKADEATGKHQRLVVYATGILQPREFYLH